MTKSELFKSAHAMARNTVKAVGNYMVAFKLALINLYQSLKAPVKTVEQKLVELGASVWEGYGHRRIYINASLVESVFGLCVRHYKTGNISNVNRRVNGEVEHYSNRKGGEIYSSLCDCYYDLNKNEWASKWASKEYIESFLVI